MAERMDTGGLAAALALLGAQGGLVDDGGAQVDMFENDLAPLPLPVKGTSGAKGGRPAGARNRSTDAWIAWFLNQHRSPLSVLGNIASQDVRELHALLQDMADARTRLKTRATENGSTEEEVRVLVDPLAVLKLQRDAAVALLPYIHKQQPKAIEIEQKRRGIVLLGDLEDVGEDGSDDLALPLPKVQENQGGDRAARQQSETRSAEESRKEPENSVLRFEEH